LRERFRQDLPVLRLHSDTGGEFSSDLLRDVCRGEGILQSFMLSDSPKKNGIAERRIGLVMEVARTSMIHAAAPHFLWPFAVRYAAHQLNLWPRVSLPETSPTLRWTGKFGDASVFRVWGSRAFVCDTSTNKLSASAIPCVFLVFCPDAPGWQFYHPTSRRVFPSQDVTFDESVHYYQLSPYRSAPPPPPPLFVASGPPLVDPLPPQGHAPLGVSYVDPLPGTVPVEGAVDSGAARGAASRGVASGGAEPRGAEPGGTEPGGAESEGAGTRGAEPWGAEPAGVESGGAEPEGVDRGGAESGGAEPQGTASSGGPAGASPRLSPQPEPLSLQQLREWFTQRTCLRSGATGAGDSPAGDTGAGGAGVTAGAGGTGGAAAAGPGGARTRGTGAAGTGSVGGAGAGHSTEPGAAGAEGTGAGGTSAAFALLAPSPYTEQASGLTKHRKPAFRPASPLRTGRRFPCLCPPLVPGTHAMELRPSSVPLRVPLPPPPASPLPAVPEFESHRARAADPTVSCPLATAVSDPSFESTVASALVAELVEFCALGTDVLENRQEDFECLTAAVPRFASMLLAPEGDPDAPDIPTPRSYAEAITDTYVDAVPPSRANIVDGMWIFKVKRPPGSPPAFKARYVARGFSQR
ncbi:unnamed protein product, partial [Closterium sp. NIES-54]